MSYNCKSRASRDETAMVYPGQIFEHLQGEFFAAIEAARAHPDHKVVHRLRTTARRMEALLLAAKEKQDGDTGLGRSVDRALKALKPVRSAAGPVRDMDVQRGLLEELVVSAKAGLTPLERIAFIQAEHKLQAKLKRRRDQAEETLAKVIQRSEKRLTKRVSLVQSDLSGQKWTSLMKETVASDGRAAKEVDTTDPESLHAYRKRSKFARYLAEMDGKSKQSAQFAERLRKVLDAIGEWHDWMLLAQLAKETVGKSSTLTNVLREERDKALRRAVRAVERRTELRKG